MGNEITIKTLDACHVISKRKIRYSDDEIRGDASALYAAVPPSQRRGPPMAVFHWETIVPDGQDVEVCVPVDEDFHVDGYTTRTLRAGHGVYIRAEGDPSGHGAHYRRILELMVEKGIHPRSQREIYYDLAEDAPTGMVTGLIIVMHPWLELLETGLEATLGTAARERILEGMSDITPCTDRERRAEWIKGVISRIESEAQSPEKRYAAISGCADFFPQERIDAYRHIYRSRHSVDDVIDFMRSEQYWFREPYRNGAIVYVTKNPRNRQAYEAAKTAEDKRRHYCHCTMLRNVLDHGISPTFCYCGAGWFRQQWEGTLEEPVEIRVEKSVLNGDDACTFAIHLPESVLQEE